jgi:glycosyltransferase involved in cell wall biosynthesis
MNGMSQAKHNIVLVINDLKGNGAERVAITLAEAFRNVGHQASIVCFKKHIELPIPASVPVFIFPQQRFRWIPRSIRGRLIAPWLDRFIRKHTGTPNLVLSSLMPADRIMAYSHLPKVHFIIQNTLTSEVESYFPDKQESELAERKKIYQRKPCICASHGVESDLRVFLGNSLSHKVTTIHNPIDEDQVIETAEEIAPDIIPNAIIHLGKFKKQKRQDRLIRAYHASDCPYPLVFIGQGPLLPEARSLVKELKLNDRVHFIGFRKNPYPYVKAARLMVLCSDFEGLGVVLLEALCLKTAAISSDCPSGPREVLPEENLCHIGEEEEMNISNLTKLLRKVYPEPEKYTVSLGACFKVENAITRYLDL